jgi:glucose-1-phosphate thymidylyltransferase
MARSTPRHLTSFRDLLGDGVAWGMRLGYAEQPQPEGPAQAFIIGRHLIGDDDVTLVLDDNSFYGYLPSGMLRRADGRNVGATVFGYYVRDPERYGVAEDGTVVSIEEKPARPKFSYGVTGVYPCDDRVIDSAAGLGKSAGGEFEITDVNLDYLRRSAAKGRARTRSNSAWAGSMRDDTGQAGPRILRRECCRTPGVRHGTHAPGST